MRQGTGGRLRAALLAAVAVIATGPASAQTLEEALASAYTTNPELLAERARLRATDEGVAQANAGWRPQITASGSASWDRTTIDSSPVAITDGESEGEARAGTVSVVQPIFRGGRTIAGISQAKAAVRAGRAQLTGVEQGVLLDAVTAYTNVVRDDSVVQLSTNSVEVLTRQRQAAQDRFDVGEITRTDVAQAEAALSAAKSQLTAAQAQLAASRSFYERTVGTVPSDLQTEPTLPATPATLDEAVANAIAANPTLIAAREGEALTRAGIDLAAGALLPSVSVTGQYQASRDETTDSPLGESRRDIDAYSVTAGVSVPLYQGGAEYASLREAKQLNSRSRLQVADADRQVREAVANAWNNLKAARDRVVSSEEQVKANEIAFEGVQQEAEVGARTTLDVLEAEQTLLNSRVSLVTARRDTYVASYALLAAMGQLTAEGLKLPVEIYDPEEHYDDVAGKWIGFGSTED